MQQRRKDLQQFDMNCLNEIRRLRKGDKCYFSAGANSSFWDELESILKNPENICNVWERKPNDDVVLGEVWYQKVGEYHYKHTVHVFEYMYVESEGLVIDQHGHNQRIHGGKQVRKTREFYIFPDGRIEMCGKDCKHRLINNYGKPIYVLSLKICSNGNH